MNCRIVRQHLSIIQMHEFLIEELVTSINTSPVGPALGPSGSPSLPHLPTKMSNVDSLNRKHRSVLRHTPHPSIPRNIRRHIQLRDSRLPLLGLLGPRS